jgi:hypothetical protein
MGKKIEINMPFCISSYLTFRYVAKKNVAWKKGFLPIFPSQEQQSLFGVENEMDVLERLSFLLKDELGKSTIGLLLSSGIDSAILAALLPRGTPVYTVYFKAENNIDESHFAKIYALHYHLEHHTVAVTWEDYLAYSDRLMLNKKSPLHAVEVGLFMASAQARRDGVELLILGNGADSTFGGLDKLLKQDWAFKPFINRYSFINPALAVNEPVSMVSLYEKYKCGELVDVQGFLKEVHGIGIIQAFDNAIHLGGCSIVAPYELLFLKKPLDLDRIRSGESKYILRKLFKTLYPGIQLPKKIAFARPMDEWLKDWRGPRRKEFRTDIDM